MKQIIKKYTFTGDKFTLEMPVTAEIKEVHPSTREIVVKLDPDIRYVRRNFVLLLPGSISRLQGVTRFSDKTCTLVEVNIN